MISAYSQNQNYQVAKQCCETLLSLNYSLSTLVQNQLADVLAKAGDLPRALEIFNQLRVTKQTDVYSWTIIINALSQHNKSKLALEYFQQMLHDGIQPNEPAYVAVLSAVTELGDPETGKTIHQQILKSQIPSSAILVLDMYGRCGELEIAKQLFEQMKAEIPLTVVSWTIIINACGVNGDGNGALEYFKQMQLSSITPNSQTLTAVLNACSHSNLLIEAK
jgi:pentatricopeptide repeat protein